jgi:hypothetical protein
MIGSTLSVLLFPSLVLTSFTDATIVEASGTISFGNFEGEAEIVYSDEGKDSLRLPPDAELVLNVMLPPENHRDLCEYPSELQNVATSVSAEEDEDVVNDDDNPTLSPTAHSNFKDSLLENGITIPIEFDFSPIAFLVPLQRRRNGSNITDCDLLTKIKVALQYQREVIRDRKLWSIIFYNSLGDDEWDQDIMEIDSLSFSSWSYFVESMKMPHNLNSTDIPGLDSLLLATISLRMGMQLLEELKFASSNKYILTGDNVTFASYYLLNKGNPDWRFPVSLHHKVYNPLDRFKHDVVENQNEDDDWATGTFFWFGLVLVIFIFCIISVQCSRMRLEAGGRFELRRNDRGGITGVVHQPAPQNLYDILATVRNNNRNRIATSGRNKLTKKQVLALPEIEYVGRPECSKVRDDHQNDDLAQENLISVDRIKVESEQDDIHRREAKRNQTGSNPINFPAFTTNINTVCSICIEEFQHGEKVRLLPRCGHAFHTDCILPWLTEGQEYCPCCKMAVLSFQNTEKGGEVAEGQQLEEGHGAADDSRQPQ